jgi:hypothetical protein
VGLSETGYQGNGEDCIMGSFIICTQCYFGDQMRKNEMASMGERRGVYRVVVGEHEGKRILGRCSRK